MHDYRTVKAIHEQSMSRYLAKADRARARRRRDSERRSVYERLLTAVVRSPASPGWRIHPGGGVRPTT